MLLKLHYYCHIKAILYPLISHSQFKFGRHHNITVNDKAHNYIHYKLSIINIRKFFYRLEYIPTRDLRLMADYLELLIINKTHIVHSYNYHR